MKLALSTVLVTLCAIPGLAQVTTGSLAGFVTDPSGKPVQNAKVRADDKLHSVVRHTTTDSTGFFRLAGAPASVYSVGVAADGFEPVNVEEVRVAINSDARVDVQLRLAGMVQTLEVKASVRGIQTSSSDLSAVFDEAALRGLPLNQRDFLQLSMLTPGVSPPVQDSELSTRGSFAMHANGGREEFNNFLLDGVDNNDQTSNRYVLQPPVDSIQEFKIETNAYRAEYGRSGAGQVNVLTRSGNNQWHGFAYEYLRNRAMDWQNYFDSGEKANYSRNQFGAGIGGPAVKEKTFFFATFDGLRSRQGLSRLATVPGEAERTGNLSSLGSVIEDPFTGTPFPGNQIPAARISPIARQILSLFPAPNRSGASGNYLGQPVLRDSQTQFNGRIDRYFTASDRLTLRYSRGVREMFEPFAEESTGIPGFGDFPSDGGHNAMVHYQHEFSPSVLNSLLIGLNRATREILSENRATDVNKSWGVTYLPTQSRDFGYPGMTIAGYSHIGDPTQLPIRRTATTYQLTEGLSIVRNGHALKLGLEVRNMRNNGILDLLARGSLSFSGAISGSGVSDLLLGYPSFGLQSKADNMQTQRTTSYNAYLQDDWKVSGKFTVNLGLRYEFNSPPTDPSNRMSVFDLKSMKTQQVGANGISRSGLRPDWNNIAPRIGFAWALTPNTVLRGGYGVFYDSGILVVNSSVYFNPPYFNIYVFFPTETSLLALTNPFPTKGGFAPPASLSTLSSDFVTAYLQHWNLNLQHQVRPLGIVTLAYAGSKGTHLIRSRDLNQPYPGPGDLEDRRPYPAFSNIFFSESGSNSAYHSLQASLSRPMAHGFSLLGVYTFSKSIDDTSAFLSTVSDRNFPQDSHNFGAERGLSSFDMTHRVSLAFVQRFPGKQWWSRNFETSGILVAQSGQPFTPVLQFDNSNTGNTGGNFGSDRPNLLRNPKLANPTADRWFDTSAFAIPAADRFGSAGRNIVRGPGLATFDVALARKFAISETGSLQFQAQAFNLFNRTNFDLPQLFADDPGTFGKVFSAKSPRQVQVAVRLTF
ncbi:MAG: TonB-dependent receptor [Candidatus Solibacter sp.]|nr:TonB-dependent receptor [Candidatus Solibacter sp.]